MVLTTMHAIPRFRAFTVAAIFTLSLFYLLAADSYLGPSQSAVLLDKALELAPEERKSATTPTASNSAKQSSEPTLNPPRILLVSAMFPLVKSKHSKAEYAEWLSYFLNNITTDVYFYTTPDMEPTVRWVASANLNITVNTSYASPFDILPLRGLGETYNEMHEWDREKHRHVPELYAIWNAKPFFLDEAVRTLASQGQHYDYAFWNDAGSFRVEHRYSAWPSDRRIQEVWDEGSRKTGKKEEDLLFFPIFGLPSVRTKSWVEDDGPVDEEFSEGSFFGGRPHTIHWWRRIYYEYHNHYLSRGIFVGKDQTLINALFLLFPDRIFTVWMSDPDAQAHKGLVPHFDESYLGACGPVWYYYQFWLADRETRREMRLLWLDRSSWAAWGWWKSRQPCRLTQALGMREVLVKRFGKGWQPPARSVLIPAESSPS
ncbi:hypothetical protein BDQ12DRAFT_674141 [Crucibulum laeve]|uniref:Uncharacterized protein n=1 Tax=Crucibulum laeve TaxID=68775 RepID=A0A5C3MK93_9AGAR|nr:hypothetical protein BDQ12DRAFT_674141 [Crucibulum laeve]